MSVQRTNLLAGAHSFEIRMFENGGTATLLANWTGPGITDQLIPSTAFKSGISVTGTGTPSDPWVINATSALDNVTADSRNLKLSTLNVTREIQRVSTTATAGSFTLVFRGEETDPILWNSGPEKMKAALEALNSIGKWMSPASVPRTRHGKSRSSSRVTRMCRTAGWADQSDCADDHDGSRPTACTSLRRRPSVARSH